MAAEPGCHRSMAHTADPRENGEFQANQDAVPKKKPFTGWHQSKQHLIFVRSEVSTGNPNRQPQIKHYIDLGMRVCFELKPSKVMARIPVLYKGKGWHSTGIYPRSFGAELA